MQTYTAGQWTSESSDDSSATYIVDIDGGVGSLAGTARVFFADGRPGTICEIKIPEQINGQHRLTVPLYWMPPGQPVMLSRHEILERYPDQEFPDSAQLLFECIDNDHIQVEWTTPIGTGGKATLARSKAGSLSEIESQEMNWDQFKQFALGQKPGSLIFRGQPDKFKLRTSFHRTYRKDLIRYVKDDIPVVHRQLTARTQHLFDLYNPQQTGAFYNLLQHHGYPTPLLDWTYSPFVAAFFAYRKRKPKDHPTRNVRILAFEKEAWVGQFSQLETVNFAQHHFSILEALAIENNRAIPQQAVSTLTNVDDIEAYIRTKEAESNQTFLHAIDLQEDCRPEVMVELSLMGITAGSLFPGLDGACEELMGRFFHHQVVPRPNN